ncbi:MAG: PfkB family carbohydrate kinase, partial [Armatimonadaceae bacterium]
CSMDVNFWAKLWNPADAGTTLTPFLDQLDWCICNENHARMLFDLEPPLEDSQLASELARRHPNLRKVAITRRRTVDPDHDHWGATLWSPDSCVASPTHRIRMVDRVGGGDSFAAGLIHALLEGRAPQDAVDFGAAALALKHTIVGDFAAFRASEVETMRNSAGSISVQR